MTSMLKTTGQWVALLILTLFLAACSQPDDPEQARGANPNMGDASQVGTIVNPFGDSEESCDVNPNQTKCVTSCEANPKQAKCADLCQTPPTGVTLTFCDDVCPLDGGESHTYCDIEQCEVDPDLPECNEVEVCQVENPPLACDTTVCNENNNSPYCSNQCLENPDLPFCSDQCAENNPPAYCSDQCLESNPPATCELSCENYPDDPSLDCAQTCDFVNGSLEDEACKDACSEANTPDELCETFCDPNATNPQEFCEAFCRDDQPQPYCINFCDVEVGETLPDFCKTSCIQHPTTEECVSVINEFSLSLIPPKRIRMIWQDNNTPSINTYKLEGHKGHVDGPLTWKVEGLYKVPTGQLNYYDLIMPLYNRTWIDSVFKREDCDSSSNCVNTGVNGIQYNDISKRLLNGIGYLKHSSPAENSRSGSAVAVSGNGLVMAVSSYKYDEVENDTRGVVSIYERQVDDQGKNTNWKFVIDIEAPIGTPSSHDKNNFGNALSLDYDGNVLAVGANGTRFGTGPNETGSNHGAVYIYTKNGTSGWGVSKTLRGYNTPVKHARFGTSVSLNFSGNELAVGAPGVIWAFNPTQNNVENFLNGPEQAEVLPLTGRVFVYKYDGSDWVQKIELKHPGRIWVEALQDHYTIPEELYAASFGHSVSLSGNGHTLAIGAPYLGVKQNDQDNPEHDGAVYIYRKYFTVEGDEYAKWADNHGYAFRIQPGELVNAEDLTPDSSVTAAEWKNIIDSDIFYDNNDKASQYFGYSVSLDYGGNNLVVGAIGDYFVESGTDLPKEVIQGGVYHFTRSYCGNDKEIIKDGFSNVTYFDCNIWKNRTANIGIWNSMSKNFSSARVGEPFLADPGDGTDTAAREVGCQVRLNGSGGLLAVAACGDSAKEKGVQFYDGSGELSSLVGGLDRSGAIYMFKRSQLSDMSVTDFQRAVYIKAPNPDVDDHFGRSISLSSGSYTQEIDSFDGFPDWTWWVPSHNEIDLSGYHNEGDILVVGAPYEDSGLAGDINNSGGLVVPQVDDNSLLDSGAVYLY